MNATTHKVRSDAIPEHWQRLDLSRLDFIKGKAPQELIDGADEGYILYLSPDYLRNMSTELLHCPTKQAVTVSKDQPIVLWDGSNAGEVFLSKEGALASTMCKVIAPPALSPKYLYYFLKSKENEIKSRVKGSGIPHVDKYVFGELDATFPLSSGEQQSLVMILTAVDYHIAAVEAQCVKLTRIKQGLMQDLLTRGIDEHGNIRSEKTHKFKDSPLGRIPEEWDVKLLDQLAERGSGHTPDKSHPNYWNGGIKWVSLADSDKLDQIYIFETAKEISTEGLRHSSAVLHPSGTVILSRDAGVGKSAILATNMAVSQHFMAWRCGPRLNNHYLYFWLQNDKRRFEAIAFGSTILTIGLPFFKQYTIAIPNSVREQELIVERLLSVERAIDVENAYARKLVSLKRGIMDDLLTGKVRVNHLIKQ